MWNWEILHWLQKAIDLKDANEERWRGSEGKGIGWNASPAPALLSMLHQNKQASSPTDSGANSQEASTLRCTAQPGSPAHSQRSRLSLAQLFPWLLNLLSAVLRCSGWLCFYFCPFTVNRKNFQLRFPGAALPLQLGVGAGAGSTDDPMTGISGTQSIKGSPQKRRELLNVN